VVVTKVIALVECGPQFPSGATFPKSVRKESQIPAKYAAILIIQSRKKARKNHASIDAQGSPNLCAETFWSLLTTYEA
jgi:hypothetical protein